MKRAITAFAFSAFSGVSSFAVYAGEADIKLPPEVLKTMPINGQWRADIPQENMARWIAVMERQKMLRTKLDLKKLVAE